MKAASRRPATLRRSQGSGRNTARSRTLRSRKPRTINGAIGCQCLARNQHEARKVRRWSNRKRKSIQCVVKSVLKLRSPELERIWRRERGNRGSGGDWQCRILAPNRAAIGDFRHRLATGEYCTGRNWRRGRDSNPRYGYPYSAFRVRRDRPLCHLSARPVRLIRAAR